MKYKRCCGSGNLVAGSVGAPSPDERPIFVVGDPEALYNRVEREAKIVAENFDDLCRDNVADIKQIYVAAANILIAGMKSAEQQKDEIRQTLSIVLSNALKSFTAAFSLLRTGWRLQPYQCLRNCMEAISVTLHLFAKPEDLT